MNETGAVRRNRDPAQHEDAVTQPLIVSIPHNLGKDEAIRRMKAGLGSVTEQYGNVVKVDRETWTGDRLNFAVTAMMQQVSGNIDVADDHVRLEVTLPWLLARLANGAQALIRDKGKLLLEKK
jgi:hypothetical protein